MVALEALGAGAAWCCSRSKWRPPVATTATLRSPPLRSPAHLARTAAEAAGPLAARGTRTRTETAARTAGDCRAGSDVRLLRSGTLSAMEGPVEALRTVSRRTALVVSAGSGGGSKSAARATVFANPGERRPAHGAAGRWLCSNHRALPNPRALTPPVLWSRPAGLRSARTGGFAGGDGCSSHVKPLASTRGGMAGPPAGKRSDSSSARIRFLPPSHSLQP